MLIDDRAVDSSVNSRFLSGISGTLSANDIHQSVNVYVNSISRAAKIMAINLDRRENVRDKAAFFLTACFADLN